MYHVVQKNTLHKLNLASGLVGVVGSLVETGVVVDLHDCVVKAGVARHEGLRNVVEADRRNVVEGVVDELGAIGFLKLDALEPPADNVFPQNVVLRPSGVHHIGRVGSKVRVNVVPEQGVRQQREVVGSRKIP